MLSAKNLNALDDAGYSFIVGSRISKAPYDLAEHFERHGTYFANGQILESTRVMGTGKAARSLGDTPWCGSGDRARCWDSARTGVTAKLGRP